MNFSKIAFFDFDDTIICEDSFIGFSKYALGTKKYIISLILSIPYIVSWKLGIISNSRAKEMLFNRMFKGLQLETFNKLCEEYAGRLKPNGAILHQIKHLQQQGVEIVIVSASIRNWIEPFAKRLSIRHIIATEIEIESENKLLTGKFNTPNCFGPEKVNRILQIFNLRDTEIWSFSDSMSDRPLFNISDYPFLVSGNKISPLSPIKDTVGTKWKAKYSRVMRNINHFTCNRNQASKRGQG